ncbi:hypothetical protein DOY81_012285 [Sarcophaga bullata]|nr:hypothetical protein DOY81_012285 [Sarcophaga bullata]
MPRPIASQEDEDPTPYLFVSLEQRRIDQSKPYDSKKNCWVPDEKEGYLLGEIKATKGDIVTVGLPGGEVKDFKADKVEKTNPPKYEKIEDMADMTVFEYSLCFTQLETALLCQTYLQQRFQERSAPTSQPSQIRKG